MPPQTTGKETLAARVGERLRTRRTELGRTLSDVAGDADVSVSYLSAVEHGASVPSLAVLARVVHALGLPLAEVLREEGQNRVRRDRLTLDGSGSRWVSHEDLQLDVAFLAAQPGERGDCPVPVAGWYGLKKGLRGRFGNYVPPVLEALGLAEVEHNARNNRMRAL